jgi:hypothetical protein
LVTSSNAPSLSSNAAVGNQEVARVGQAVAADRPQVRQLEHGAKVFADIAACDTIRQADTEADTARNQGNFLRFHVEYAKLGFNMQAPLLRHDEEFTIGIAEPPIRHVAIGDVDMDADSALGLRRSVTGHGVDAFDEIHGRCGNRQRIPAQLIRGYRAGTEITVECRLDKFGKRTMHRSGSDAIQPTAPICMPGCRECRAAHLLGIQAMRHVLRRIAALRQGARNGFGGELVAETCLVTR